MYLFILLHNCVSLLKGAYLYFNGVVSNSRSTLVLISFSCMKLIAIADLDFMKAWKEMI